MHVSKCRHTTFVKQIFKCQGSDGLLQNDVKTAKKWHAKYKTTEYIMESRAIWETAGEILRMSRIT